MSSSKIDHKEFQRRLKEDELSVFLQEFTAGARSFFQKYGRALGLLIALIVVIFFGVYFMQMKAQDDFQQSQILFSNGASFVSQGNYQQAITTLNELINQYPNQPVSTIAHVLRGNCYYNTEQYDNALSDYTYALPHLDEVDAIPVQIAIVQTRRSLGQYQEALNELDKMEEKAKSDALKEQILFLKASCYEDLNQDEKALELYKKIPAESGWYGRAVERIEWLEAKPVGAINPS